MIDSEERSQNRIDLSKNINYRLNKVFKTSLYNLDKGKSPGRTSLEKIAEYTYKDNEGTNPGVLGSSNYYLPASFGYFIETIVVFLITRLIAIHLNILYYVSNVDIFLVTSFIVEPFLGTPYNYLMLDTITINLLILTILIKFIDIYVIKLNSRSI